MAGRNGYRVAEILAVALVYFLTARIGQAFAIPPGNVTAIWLPSGLMFAWAMVRGSWIWPGIFLGAFVGNVSAYLDFSSVSGLLYCLLAGTANGFGDVVATAVMAAWVRRLTRPASPLNSLRGVGIFLLLGVVLGGLISALFGVTGLATAGFVPWTSFLYTLETWWTGASVSVVVLAPFLMALGSDEARQPMDRETAMNFAVVTLLCYLGFFGGGFDLTQWMATFLLAPALIWALMRLNQTYVLFLLIVLTGTAILSTFSVNSLFLAAERNLTLVYVQLFSGASCVLVLFLRAAAIENRLIEESLVQSEQRQSALLEAMPDLVFVLDPNGIFLEVLSPSEDLLLIPAKQILGRNQREFFPGKEAARFQEMIDLTLSSGQSQLLEYSLDLADGEHHFEGRTAAIPNYSGDRRAVTFVIRDITQHRQAQSQLRLAASVFESSGEGIVITDLDANIIDVNPAFSHITGFSREEVIGENPNILGSGRQDSEFYQAMWHALLATGQWRGEIWNRSKDGTPYVSALTIATARDADNRPTHFVGLFSDVTAAKVHEQELEHLAHYDSLTNLPNRMLLADRLKVALSHCRREGGSVAVIYIDLDGFKAINDNHGHLAGDAVLVTTAHRMRDALRDVDSLCRMGGDEFAAILTGLKHPNAFIPTVQRLLECVRKPVSYENKPLRVSASIGVTLYPQHGEADAETLLRQADMAMYRAKTDGKNQYRLYDNDHCRPSPAMGFESDLNR
ncbi:MAG: diguanylate cyclase [Xanthomonadales bacterium]|nr:diguanylate cyclase [Xanthomonadales bacterium]